MYIIHLQLLAITLLICLACALPGVLLVLRGTAMMSDAISHAVLPGIALMFLWTRTVESPLLMCGAILSGIITVVIAEWIIQSKKLHKDAAIGIIYPLFFSIGVIIINQIARNIHIDTDIVLLGEMALAPFNRAIIFGIDIGPQALYSALLLCLINGGSIWLLYKEFALTTLDPLYAHTIGFRPQILHYLLMVLTSITTVVAFDSVGSIMVIALMITPAATACLLTHKFTPVIIYTLCISITAGCIGYAAASLADVSIGGSIATISGCLFCVTLALQKIVSKLRT
jgi:manganese/zinc/iron transport system permease protein